MLNIDTVDYWPQLNKPHLILDDIKPVVELLSSNEHIDTQTVGYSFLGHPIHSLTLGQGEIKVLAWTQMHGDEATATAAVMDVLSHLLSDSAFLPLEQFCAMFTFRLIPMLNPDGAQAQTRINAQGIDINRDAKALQSPEGQVLRQAVEAFKPNVALNLHDQSPYYTVGDSSKPATIAFLAPAYDLEKSVNTSRRLAMQLIAGMRDTLEPFIQNCIARYNDDYSFRSFGDNIAGLGASTILIESGAHPNDPNRQVARKMNVISILRCFELLASKEYENFSDTAYFAIPENTENGLGDVLIRKANLPMQNSEQHFQADIMLKRHKRPDLTSFIEAIGDLSHLNGFTEIDCSTFTLSPGKPFVLNNKTELNDASYKALLQQGFTHFVGEPMLIENNSSYSCLIIDPETEHSLMPNRQAFMILYDKQQPYLAILDNQLISLQS